MLRGEIMEKPIVCDSSSLISLTESCFFPVIDYLTKKDHLRFLITEGVVYETISHPLRILRESYALSALKVKDAVEKGVILERVRDEKTIKLTEELLECANNMFYMRGRPLELVHEGEAEMLAFAYANDIPFVLMDERTTRLLVESPLAVKDHLESEFHINVMVNKDKIHEFRDITEGISVVRSIELLAFAYTRGYFDHFSEKQEIFRAALYKLKYSGCAISYDEIEEVFSYICKR